MSIAKAELIFHPVRMRVLQMLLRSGALTAGQLGELLGDVPPATLYRHLKHLTTGGVIEVVEERPVRGVVERVYSVVHGGASLTPEEIRDATPDDHVRYCAVFLAGLLEQFESYTKKPNMDVIRDGAGYRQAAIYASDDEMAMLIQQIKDLIAQAGSTVAAPGRKRRLLAGICIPVDEPEKPA
jgi:DNA-binding transcriptional ArsR family regulator